ASPTGEGWTSPICPATERRIRESGGGLGGTCRGVLPDGFRHRQTANSKPPSFTPKSPKGPVIHLGANDNHARGACPEGTSEFLDFFFRHHCGRPFRGSSHPPHLINALDYAWLGPRLTPEPVRVQP